MTVPSPRSQTYRPLSADELTGALRQLHDWHGDSHRIARTVRPRDMWSLLERVADAEAQLDHHALVDLEAGCLTFVLWTHVRDSVTDVDLALAHRIDDLVDA